MKKIVLGILAHVDAGKTTLSEALLYQTGAIRKPGRVDNRDSFLDTDILERRRGITIFSKQALFQTANTEFTLLDTPGHVDFSTETERTLRILDYAILVISAADGIREHTKTLWRLLSRCRIPVFLFVNKMDMPGTSRGMLLEQLRNSLSANIIDFSDIDNEDTALCDEELLEEYLETGIINRERLSACIKERRIFPCFFGSALKFKGIDELINGLDSYTIMPDYPSEFGASVYKIARDRQGTRLTFLKVTGGSAVPKMPLGADEKINQIRIYSGDKFISVKEAPSGTVCAVTGIEASKPGLSYGCDNTIHTPMLAPVLMYSLKLPEGTDALAFLPKLRQLEEEEPELNVVWNEALQEIRLQVMGPVQTEILKAIISERYGVDAEFGNGSIIYKETIKNKVEGVGHFEPLKHYAEVHLILEPGEQGSGTEFVCKCSEDLLEKNWQRLIMTHLAEKNHTGVLTGSPLTDIKITLAAGRAHKKHTEGGDFRQATYRAVRQGLMQAESVLLEPYYTYTLSLPQSCIGRAMTDFERMGGTCVISENQENGGHTGEGDGFGYGGTEASVTLTGRVPVRTLGDYHTELTAYTRGQGKLSCVPDGYSPCKDSDRIIAEIGYEPEHDTANPADSVFCSHGSGFLVPWNEVQNYMHLESVLNAADGNRNDSISSESEQTEADMKSRADEADFALGTDEIDEIINRTAYANSHDNPGKWKHTKGHRIYENGFANRGGTAPKNDVSNYSRSFPKKQLAPYLLVDGYNIIFAWRELSELAEINLDAARGRLLDILCNYQAMKQCSLIAVFDAYRIKGHETEISDYHNIHVVFTKEAETADQYIEKFAHEHHEKYDIRVATSDGLEQIIILGQGCTLVSAREFENEIKELEQSFRETYVDRTY